MRKSKLSAAEIAEMDETKQSEADQRKLRNTGYALMSVRDRGYKKLSNGVTAIWHTKTPPTSTQNGWEVTQGTIPDGTFGIKTNDEIILFDAEELSKYLRWA